MRCNVDGRVIKVLRKGTENDGEVKTEAVLYGGKEIEVRDVVSAGGTVTTRPGRASVRQIEDILSLVRGMEATPPAEEGAGKVLHPTTAKGKRRRKK